MKRFVVHAYLIALITLPGCSGRQVSILSLKMELLSYEAIPPEVQEMFGNTAKYSQASRSPWLIYVERENLYTFQTEKTGPFLDYHLITDVKRSIDYKIPYGKHLPYVVFKNAVFILDRPNVVNTDLVKGAMYEKYYLIDE